MSLRSGAARAVGVGPTASPGLSTIQVFEANTDDGFGCLDMADAIRELDLSQHEFTTGDGACTSLLADWDRLEYWWEDR